MTRSDDRSGRSRAALIALAFFALGLLAARLLGWLSPSMPGSSNQSADLAPSASSTTSLFPDAGGPRIFLDPASISLLPDASLELHLPDAPDAGPSLP